MIIVYLSIALAVLAIIYLVVSSLRTFKSMQPAMKSMSGTGAKIQKQMEGVQEELEHLKKKADAFQQEIADKKQLVQDVITNVKWSGEEFKSLWKWAWMMPNPKKVEKVELSPEARRIVDLGAKLVARWQEFRR